MVNSPGSIFSLTSSALSPYDILYVSHHDLSNMTLQLFYRQAVQKMDTPFLEAGQGTYFIFVGSAISKKSSGTNTEPKLASCTRFFTFSR